MAWHARLASLQYTAATSNTQDVHATHVQEENEEEIEYLDDVDFVESDEDMEDAAYGSGSDASEGIRMTCWIHDESGVGGRVWLVVDKPVMGIHDKHCACWNRCGA